MRPKVGQTIDHHILGECVIIAVHDFGTLDVEDNLGNCYRVTGLDFI